MRQKFDVKKELIKCKFCNKVLRTQGAILGSIRDWEEKYREKGELEYQRACNIQTRLLKAISRLTESETNAIITLIDPNTCWDSENINSI
ncbi:MAG: hypothetical protein KGD59_11755 [Candidatus Heimdallarchaeota archaeon]|nr:hypothetical protein [Candidatus Heimdallarchaeota archaeon]